MPTYCQGEVCVGQKKRAEYGLKDSRTKQWCSGCAKKQGGETVLIGAKMCEGVGRSMRASA